MSDQVTKRCPKCETEKLLSEFGKDAQRNKQPRRWCKACVRAAARRQAGSAAAPVDEFPADLMEAAIQLALQELYARLHDPATAAEISTHTLAKIACDLARLELAKGVSSDGEAVRERNLDVLRMVEGLPVERQLEVLKAALPDAESPEPIRRAIAELEGRGDGS